MKPASEKRTRAWAETQFSNFQLANSGYSKNTARCARCFLNGATDWAKKTASPSTVNRYFRVCRRVWEFARAEQNP